MTGETAAPESGKRLTETEVRRIAREELANSKTLPVELERICANLPAHAAMAVRRAWVFNAWYTL